MEAVSKCLRQSNRVRSNIWGEQRFTEIDRQRLRLFRSVPAKPLDQIWKPSSPTCDSWGAIEKIIPNGDLRWRFGFNLSRHIGGGLQVDDIRLRWTMLD